MASIERHTVFYTCILDHAGMHPACIACCGGYGGDFSDAMLDPTDGQGDIVSHAVHIQERRTAISEMSQMIRVPPDVCALISSL